MIEFQLEEIVTLNGRQIDAIDIHEGGPLVPLTLRRSQGGGVIRLGGTGQIINLSINPDSSDWQWLDSLSRQSRYSLDLRIHIGTLRKKIGKRGYIANRVHDTWHIEFPDWEISQ